MIKSINKTNILDKKTDNTKSILNDTIGGHTMNDFETLQSTRQQNIYYTKLLLEKYRDIVWALKFFSENNNVITDTQSIQNLIRTYPQVKSLLQAINQTVKQIRYKPNDGEDMFEIINKAYIDKCKISNEKICEEMYISEAHFYRKKKLAIKLISERIWNSSHKDVDSWRKFVEALDDNRQRKKVS